MLQVTEGRREEVPAVRRIAVIGNPGGGKTVLSRSLSHRYGLALTHVDSVQYLPGRTLRAIDETRWLLNCAADNDSWIIDGFGPMDVVERRLRLADRVVFVDLPFWRHLAWSIKRQVRARRSPRQELPPGSRATITQTLRIVCGVHWHVRPVIVSLCASAEIREKVVRVGDLRAWRMLFERGFAGPPDRAD